jgi:hypothetical protein
LHRVRANVSGLFRELPARFHLKIRQQTGHEPGRGTPWFDPPEPARETAEHPVQNLLPSGNVYAVTSGHRKI